MHVPFRLALFVTLAAAAPTGAQQLAAGRAGRGLQLRAEFYNIFDINQWIAVHAIARFDLQGNQLSSRFGQVIAAADPQIVQLSFRTMF